MPEAALFLSGTYLHQHVCIPTEIHFFATHPLMRIAPLTFWCDVTLCPLGACTGYVIVDGRLCTGPFHSKLTRDGSGRPPVISPHLPSIEKPSDTLMPRLECGCPQMLSSEFAVTVSAATLPFTGVKGVSPTSSALSFTGVSLPSFSSSGWSWRPQLKVLEGVASAPAGARKRGKRRKDGCWSMLDMDR